MSYRKIKAKYDGKIAGLYDLEGTIGKGHYAVVKLARHVFTGEKVAVKVIDKTKLDEVSRSHLFQEVRCMKLVQHPNIVRLYEVIDTQSKLYLILELGDGGDLYDYIMKHDGGLEEDMAKVYFHQIVQAIAYCHQLYVVHRDLKPENVVFFDKTGSVKLTDFGFSNKFTPGRKLETSCGSLAYSAPEILLGDSYDPPAVDVWSLGVILYMLVCGKPPFQEANDGETLIKIMDCDYTIPSRVSANCQHLIGKMLVREPSERISLDNILIHPWLNEGVVLPLPQRALVGRETLSDDEHSCIVQRIVEGKIASRDEIIHSLERSAYNHITATYYLLAERLLRRRSRHSSEKGGTPSSASALSPPNVLMPRPKSPDVLTMEEHRLNLQKLIPDSPSAPSTPSSPTPPSPATAALGPPLLAKRCSLIQEELAEEDEEMEVETDALIKLEEQFKKDERGRASIELGTERSGRQSSQSLRANAGRSLSSVPGSPQLINQIYEDDVNGPQKLLSKTERSHYKRCPIVVRGTSCSSSDTSDTDDIPVCQKPRREKTRRSFQRRDSGDHLSDTNDASTLGGLALLACRKDRSRDSIIRDEKLQEKTRRLSGDMKRRLSIEEKLSSDLIKEKRRNSVVGAVKKSVSLILGRAYIVGDNTPDVTKLNTWNSCSDLSPNVRKTLNTGSLSMRHLADRTVLGCVLARELRISRSEFLKESESLNRENRPRSRVIHVRSNDFSQLVDKFSTSSSDDKAGAAAGPDTGLRQRSRGEGSFKIDINRNALNSLNQSSNRHDSGEKQTASTMKTKCCNLV